MKLCVRIVVVTAALFSLFCPHQKRHSPGVPYYFESLEVKGTGGGPSEPIGPVAERKLHQFRSYVVAYYDDNDKIITLIKFMRDKDNVPTVFIFENYYYSDAGHFIGRRNVTL